MYNLVRTENFNTYKIRHFIVDSTSDFANIVSDHSNELHAGWSATVATSGEKAYSYILANDLSTWVKSGVTTVWF